MNNFRFLKSIFFFFPCFQAFASWLIYFLFPPHFSSHVLLRTTVVDTGVGISDEIKAKLFKPFIQGSSPNDPTRGTGLGLAICRRLCNSCNFKSVPQKGSEFWFDILVTLEANSTAEQEALPAEQNNYFFADLSLFDVKVINEPNSTPHILEGKTVLIVDDSDISQRFTAKALERMGCTKIVRAMKGEKAIEMVLFFFSSSSSFF